MFRDKSFVVYRVFVMSRHYKLVARCVSSRVPLFPRVRFILSLALSNPPFPRVKAIATWVFRTVSRRNQSLLGRHRSLGRFACAFFYIFFFRFESPPYRLKKTRIVNAFPCYYGPRVRGEYFFIFLFFQTLLI